MFILNKHSLTHPLTLLMLRKATRKVIISTTSYCLSPNGNSLKIHTSKSCLFSNVFNLFLIYSVLNSQNTQELLSLYTKQKSMSNIVLIILQYLIHFQDICTSHNTKRFFFCSTIFCDQNRQKLGILMKQRNGLFNCYILICKCIIIAVFNF